MTGSIQICGWSSNPFRESLNLFLNNFLTFNSQISSEELKMLSYLVFLLLLSASSILGHGRLTSPATRDIKGAALEYIQNAPVDCTTNVCDASFVCRDYPTTTPTTTITAGQNTPLQWTFTADHVVRENIF